MCGIAGIVDLSGAPVAARDVRSMCGVLAHRGPDDEGFHDEPQVSLGMRRLGIIDRATGRQPIGNEDGTVWVVFNGEIYNFADLRRGLAARGHVLRTAGDTECIVHLYEERGPACVEDLRGMFAFALWDARRRRLLLARDRLGVKPLYYTIDGGRIAFASEMKALLRLPGLDVALDPDAVAHLFAFLTTPPDRSIVGGIRKLEPGTVLIADAGSGARVAKYWDVAFDPDPALDEETAVERLRGLLDESVRLRLVGDVPVGAFLSGGVDSSAVVGFMARHSSAPVRTFTVGFPDAPFDEAPHAREAARHFGAEHHELRLEPAGCDLLETIAWHLDEPFGDPSAIPTFLVSRMAARHVTVVLSGDGGDELFAGYERYAVERARLRRPVPPRFARAALGALARRLPDSVPGRRFMRNLALIGADRYLDSITLFSRDDQRRLLGPLARGAGRDPWRERGALLLDGPQHWLSRLQALDLKTYLPLDILTKVDRMSMAHSLEAREPLLDHRLVEFAARVPPRLHQAGGRSKHLLKRAVEGLVPAAVLDRQKHGFAMPLRRWLRDDLPSFARDILLSRRAGERGVLDRRMMARLLRRYEAGRDLDLEIWTALSFELWCRLFLDGRGRRAVLGPDGRERAA